MESTTDHNIVLLRTMCRGNYDLQGERIRAGNRLCTNFRWKLGMLPDEADKDLPPDEARAKRDKENKKIMKTLKDAYKLITEGVINISKAKKFAYDGVISDYVELAMVDQYMRMMKLEERGFRQLTEVLERIPIYTEFLEGVRGCGPTMSSVIISEIDITKAKYASSLWMYCGLDVAPDGKGRSSRKEHLIDKEYINKQGEADIRKSLTHKRFLKTKLVGKECFGDCLIKARSVPYYDIYAGYKNRILNMEAHKEKKPAHVHNMAKRYMVKQFLVHLYEAWRPLEGLPCYTPYAEAKLDMEPHNSGR